MVGRLVAMPERFAEHLGQLGMYRVEQMAYGLSAAVVIAFRAGLRYEQQAFHRGLRRLSTAPWSALPVLQH